MSEILILLPRTQQMKIVVLDGFTLNPGDLSWSALHDLGRCEIHDRTAIDQILIRSDGANALLTNKTPISAESLARLPELRYIGVLATGYNIVDVKAAAARGIVVTNVPGYGTASVAQATFALLLELTHHVGRQSDGVRAGRWARSPDYCYWDSPLIELSGLKLGLVGLGAIGTTVANIARSFGMSVMAYTRSGRAIPGVEPVSWERLLAESDVVSLHCPLTSENTRIMNRQSLALMKPSAFLLNTSRGPLIDEHALADALNAGRLAGAGLDVLSVEPALPDNPLITAQNCIITPHTAWASRAARGRLLEIAVENVRDFAQGKASHVVN